MAVMPCYRSGFASVHHQTGSGHAPIRSGEKAIGVHEPVERNSHSLSAFTAAAKKSLSRIGAILVGFGSAPHTTMTTFSRGFM